MLNSCFSASNTTTTTFRLQGWFYIRKRLHSRTSEITLMCNTETKNVGYDPAGYFTHMPKLPWSSKLLLLGEKASECHTEQIYNGLNGILQSSLTMEWQECNVSPPAPSCQLIWFCSRSHNGRLIPAHSAGETGTCCTHSTCTHSTCTQ